jgi:RNase P subunit RPR2
MWDENERFTESTARTDKLWCSACHKKIIKGERVVFKLDTIKEKMKEVFCENCKGEFEYEVISDQRHPFDLED